MRNYLEKFYIKINLNEESSGKLLKVFDLLSDTSEKLKRIVEFISVYKDEKFNYIELLSAWRKFAIQSVSCSYESDAIFIALLTKRLEELYKERGLSEDLYIETMKDYIYKIDECECVKKTTGIFCAEFYSKFFTLEIFKFGRLEYELCTFNFDYNESINSQTKAVSIHIPRTKEPIDPKRVDFSLELARDFFKNYFNNTKILFRCSSWILWNGNKKFISENSNIALFAKRFEIINTTLYNGYNELWRIFDVEYTGLECLEGNSSLRKGYREIVSKNEKIGTSLGYFYK